MGSKEEIKSSMFLYFLSEFRYLCKSSHASKEEFTVEKIQKTLLFKMGFLLGVFFFPPPSQLVCCVLGSKPGITISVLDLVQETGTAGPLRTAIQSQNARGHIP